MATALNISAWSTTPASNSGADSTIGTVADTSSPTAVDDWTRSIMAAVKKYTLDTDGGLTSGGSANAQTLTTNRSISSGHQAAGFSLRFKAGYTNTGATTLAVDGLTAVAVKRLNGDALSAGDIVAGGIYDVAFDGTYYVLLGAGTGSGTYGTLSGANTWSGANVFTSSVTVGDGSGDTVVIKGTTVNSYMSGLLSTSSAANLRSAIGVPTGTSGAVLPFLNAANTFSGANTFTAGQVIKANTTGDGLFTLWHTDMDPGEAYQTFKATTSLFGGGTGTTGSITVTGSAGTQYNTTSDRRLKTDIRPMSEDEVYALVNGLAPVHYRWRGSGSPDFGYIAQDSYDLNPLLATPGHGEPGDEDFRPWMMEKGREGPWLAAAIRFMLQRLDALEAR